MNNAIRPCSFEMLPRLNKLDLCRLYFLTEWQPGLDYYSVLKNLHKSNSLRSESISKLPGGMTLFVGLLGNKPLGKHIVQKPDGHMDIPNFSYFTMKLV